MDCLKKKTERHSFFCCVTKRLTMVLLCLLIFLTHCPVRSFCKGDIGGGLASDEKEDSSSAGVSVEEDGEAEAEMAEYLDDEVKFVTEDDFLYEGERSHYRDFNQGARGSSNNRFSHQYERCPPLPEPSNVEASGICNAKTCQRDDECSLDGSVICCYNGCIYACLPKLNPPIAFDWIEETDLKFSSNDHGSSLPDPRLHNMGISPRALVNAERVAEGVALPGGCLINSKQYDDLLMFRKFDHVKACSCTKGEVFCEINHQPILPIDIKD